MENSKTPLEILDKWIADKKQVLKRYDPGLTLDPEFVEARLYLNAYQQCRRLLVDD